MSTSPNQRALNAGAEVTAMFLGCLIALSLIVALSSIQADRIDELAVGQIRGKDVSNQKTVLCVDLEGSRACITEMAGWKGSTILWLGNSQLPTINQWKPGEQTMVDLLHEAMFPDGSYVIGFAPPNANLQEHYVLFEHLADVTHPNELLLPVCFDDLRETGIRPQLADLLEESTMHQALTSTEIGRTLLREHRGTPSTTSSPVKLPESSMDRSEAALNSWLESSSEHWRSRGTYRSLLFVKLHHLRNAVFRISPQSVRRMIPARYERNIAALRAIIDSAAKRGIRIVLYVPPIRSDVPIPYEADAYREFKTFLEQLSVHHSLVFANLENAVLPDEWGTKVSSTLGGGQEIDYMHFSAAGHQRMSGHLLNLLKLKSPAAADNSTESKDVQ